MLTNLTFYVSEVSGSEIITLDWKYNELSYDLQLIVKHAYNAGERSVDLYGDILRIVWK